MSKELKIAICGPANPSELKEFLNKADNIPNINKGASAVNTYIKELIRQGHKILVITACVPGDKKDIVIKGEKLTIHVVRSNPGPFLSHGLSRIYMIPRLRRILKKYEGEYDILHAQWTYDFAYAALPYAKKIPVFCTVRDWCPYILSLQKGARYIQWMIYQQIFLRVMRSPFLHLIANSEYTYNCIKNSYPAKEISTIYNPIDHQLILNNASRAENNYRFVTIASSVFEYRKNVLNLLKAFSLLRSKYPQYRLAVIGDFGNKANLLSLKREGLTEDVDFLGQLSHNELIREIDNSFCLVHPSLEETFGNILIEGMARGVLVIGGKDAGAVPYVLDYGRCGLLCDVHDVNSILDALEKAINEDGCKDIVENASKAVREKYDSQTVAHQHIILYESFLKRK